MKNKTYQFALAAITLTAFLLSANIVKAAPVRINQVVQVVNAKPGKAKTGGFTQLRLADDDNTVNSTKDDSETPQDDRVIITKTIEVIEDEDCKCDGVEPITIARKGFPKWTLLGLAAIPVAVVLLNQKDKTPTPGPTTPTPGPTTPTPEPTTPNPTFTPTPEPVPEPMTILLFGTGLAGIGIRARRRLRRKTENTEE